MIEFVDSSLTCFRKESYPWKAWKSLQKKKIAANRKFKPRERNPVWEFKCLVYNHSHYRVKFPAGEGGKCSKATWTIKIFLISKKIRIKKQKEMLILWYWTWKKKWGFPVILISCAVAPTPASWSKYTFPWNQVLVIMWRVVWPVDP
jgi:hypothetical protein